MALNILHVVKRPTVLDLDVSQYGNVVPGMIAAVMNGGTGPDSFSEGTMTVAGANSAATIGVFQVPSVIPAYQSTGLLLTQIQGAPGSPGGGTRVSVVAGSGAVIQSDQVVANAAFSSNGNSGFPLPGSLLGAAASGQFQIWNSGDVVGICLQGPAVNDNTAHNDYAGDEANMYTIQLRL